MKFYYFILLLFTLLCLSCNKHNDSFDSKNAPYFTIDSLYNLSFSNNLNFNERIKITNKGILLAKTNRIDSLYLKGISNKAYHYIDVFPDSSDYYINQLISSSKNKNNKKYLAYSYSLKGNSFYNKALYDSAYYYFNNANVVYHDVNDSLSLAYNQIMMARIHQFYNDYNGSEELITQAIELLQDKETSYLIEAYNILGNAYISTQKFDEAKNYYHKSLKLTKKGSIEQLSLQNNVASLLINSSKYNDAKMILQEIVGSKLINNDVTVKATVLLNLGYTLFKQNSNKGLDQMVTSLKIKEQENMELSSIDNYIKIAEYYEFKDKNTSINYLKKALTLATKHKSIDYKISALKKLLSLTNNDTTSYSEAYIHLNDSITNVRNQAKNQFAKMRFDYSKELEQNQMLKTKEIESQLMIQKQKNTHFVLLSILVLITIVFYFIYYYIRNKHIKEKIKENYKTEQRIAIRIHDELANDVYHTISYAENTDLSNEQNKIKLLDHLEDVYNRTRNISKENSFISTGAEYVSYLKNMLLEFQNAKVKISTVGVDEFSWEDLNEIKKVVIYRIIQELLVNMKKHSKADLVVLKILKSNKYVQIQYADNGVGFAENENKLKNGLQNVETRIKTINGTITFDPKSTKGVKAVLRFPL